MSYNQAIKKPITPKFRKEIPMPPIKQAKEDTTEQYQRITMLDKQTGKYFIPNVVVRCKGDKYYGEDDGFDKIFEQLVKLENMIESKELEFTTKYYLRRFTEFYKDKSLSSEEIAEKIYNLLGKQNNGL